MRKAATPSLAIVVAENKLRIGYFGDGPWAHKALEKLLQTSDFSLEFICVRRDFPDSFLRNKAEKLGIPCFSPRNVNDPEFLSVLQQLQADLFVSMSFDQIFGSSALSTPPLGIVNCHAGKLPDYRGRNVLNWALINDEKEFGITVHFVDEGIDTGDIILQATHEITDSDTYGSLLDKAYEGCADLLFEAVDQIRTGKVSRSRQRSNNASPIICSRRRPGDELIDWSQGSREVFNFVRALSDPGPIARTTLNTSTVFVHAIRYLPDAPVYKGIPGAVLSTTPEGFVVKTGDSYVEVTRFTCERKVTVGQRFE